MGRSPLPDGEVVVASGDADAPAEDGWSGGQLTVLQEQAAVLLAAGYTHEKTAEAVGRGRHTIQRWLQNEDFKAAVRRVAEDNRRMVEGRIFALATEAAPVVQKMLRSERFERQAVGAKLALQSSVRLANRYKELQIEGFAPTPAPLIIFPPGTRPPYLAPPLECEVVATNADSDGEAE